jgi:hypothetical protein
MATDVIIPRAAALFDGAVRRIDPIKDPDWNSRLGGQPSASVFHGADWARVLQGAYGFRPFYLVCDDTRSVLPIMEVDSWLTGRRGVSLPFADECAPICREGASWERLWREALGHAEVRGWRYLECRGGRALFRNAPASTAFHGHRLVLDGNPRSRFARMNGSVRRAVRKAEQGGLSIEFSQNIDAVRVFYRLHCRTRKRHGSPPQPFGFFRQLHRHLLSKDLGWVALAWHSRTPVAGAIFFRSAKTAVYKYAASNEAWQHLRPSNLILWEAINSFALQGFEELDFGRTSLDNEGLRRFKLGWGAKECRIEYVRYDLRSRAFVTAQDRASAWHTRVFQVLPMIFSKMAGAVLYRHMA